MHLPDRAARGFTRVAAMYACRIGGHATDLLLDLVRRVAQVNGVAVRLGHLAAVEPGDLRRLAEQRLWLRQQQLAAAFKIAVKALLIADGDGLLFLDDGARSVQRVDVTLLLIALAQADIEARSLLAELADRRFGLVLEIRFAPIQMVEAPRDVAGEFDMWQLVGTNRHQAGTIDQDVRRLQQWIAEEAVGIQILVLQILLQLLVGRHPLKPAQWADHRQQQVQLGVLRHL